MVAAPCNAAVHCADDAPESDEMTDLLQPASATPRSPADLSLRDHTPARVGLARTGVSLSTCEALAFAEAHAQARDAVHATLDIRTLISALEARNLSHVAIQSAATDRATYLHRPDLGRALSEQSKAQLAGYPCGDPRAGASARLVIVFADGLSAVATDRHAIRLLDELLPMLAADFVVPAIVVAQQARVALADEIGAVLDADATLILLGERPGLSAPDSLGAYITWGPRPGRTDAERNCVSNIRPPAVGQVGLDYTTAAQKIARYLTQARRLGGTGVALSEDGPAAGAILPALHTALPLSE